MQIKKERSNKVRTDELSDSILKYGGDYTHMYKRSFADSMFYNKLTYHQWIDTFYQIFNQYQVFFNNNATYILKTKGHNYYKIGRSCNVEKRIKSLQTNCPFKLEILIKVADCSLNEKYWNKHFEKYKTCGEWYKFQDKQVRELIYAIKKIHIHRYNVYLKEYKQRLEKEEKHKGYIRDYNNHMIGL